MQRPEEELIDILAKTGVDFTASLPCEKIRKLLEAVANRFDHVPLTREEEGVGICAGAALAGRRPAMFIQSSGMGNMINALLSLTAFYELPLALFVSRRGVYREKIEAQVPMGRQLPAILAGAGITCSTVNTGRDLHVVDRELKDLFTGNRIHAFLMSPEVWEGSWCEVPPTESFEGRLRAECGSKGNRSADPSAYRTSSTASLTRFDIIRTISPYLEGKVVVSNLGWPSKELFAVKHQASNFYMLGSMGMATPIGLGISMTSSKEVVVIDGDGSLLMNPGSLATAASRSGNLTILCIDNGAYGSTGNQPTLTRNCVDLELVAQGFGFKNTAKVATKEEIAAAMKRPREGLMFIHALAVPGNRDVPNIPLHHLDVRKQVQEFLNSAH